MVRNLLYVFRIMKRNSVRRGNLLTLFFFKNTFPITATILISFSFIIHTVWIIWFFIFLKVNARFCTVFIIIYINEMNVSYRIILFSLKPLSCKFVWIPCISWSNSDQFKLRCSNDSVCLPKMPLSRIIFLLLSYV